MRSRALHPGQRKELGFDGLALTNLLPSKVVRKRGGAVWRPATREAPMRAASTTSTHIVQSDSARCLTAEQIAREQQRIGRVAAEFSTHKSTPNVLLAVPPAPPPEPADNLPAFFDLTPEACAAASVEERDAIITDLAEHDMLRLPFPRIVIRFPESEVSEILNWEPLDCRRVFYTMAFSGALKIDTIHTTRELIPENEHTHYTKEEMAERVARGESTERRVVLAENRNA